MSSQRTVIEYFKQFVNTVLIKHFGGVEGTMAEWNYFSSLMSQQKIDLEKVHLYLNVLSPATISNPFKISPEFKEPEEKKTNSGIYKGDVVGGYPGVDFSLNRTVGGNADRVKFTGMLPSRTNYGISPVENQEKKVKGKSIRVNSSMFALMDGIEQMYNRMTENHSKMQKQERGGGESKGSQEKSSARNNSYFYKSKFEDRVY